jgi:mRNA interferase HigB
MRIISIKTIKDFWGDVEYRDSEQSLKSWYYEARQAAWESPNDIKRQYGTASILNDGRIVFNIKGNRYRLVVAVNYKFKIIFIRFIGTHKNYDKINAQTI